MPVSGTPPFSTMLSLGVFPQLFGLVSCQPGKLLQVRLRHGTPVPALWARDGPTASLSEYPTVRKKSALIASKSAV